jgi:hypothetical protein
MKGNMNSKVGKNKTCTKGQGKFMKSKKKWCEQRDEKVNCSSLRQKGKKLETRKRKNKEGRS